MKPALIITAALALAGCETIPTHVNGNPVVGTRIVDGKRVYVVRSTEGDRIVTQEMAAQSREASKGIVFKGTRNQ